MTRIVRCGLIAFGCAWQFSADTARVGQAHVQAQAEQRESAYRANNRGVAFLEQFAYEPALEAFREALKLDPELRLARRSLRI